MTDIMCPKCGQAEMEDDGPDEDMTDGQESDYYAGFNHSCTCPNCGHSDLFDVGMSEPDFDDEDFEVPSEYYANAMSLLNDVQMLHHEHFEVDDEGEINFETTENKLLLRLLYGSCIIALESYLCDAFKYNVLNNEEYLKKFIRGYKPFQKEIKITLPQLSNAMEDEDISVKDLLRNYVKSELNKIIYHKLPLVKSLYSQIYKINFPEDWGDMTKEIEIRHDIFHRDGKDVDGSEREIKEDDLIAIIDKVTVFINYIEEQINNL